MKSTTLLNKIKIIIYLYYKMYASYQTFGENTPSDPLTYCLADTMDKNFQHGTNAIHYGPRSAKCQQFMAQRCAKKWDGFCQWFLVEHSNPTEWPNQRAWPNQFNPRVWNGTSSSLSIGNQLLKNTVEQKYCSYPTCQPREELFNPLDPSAGTVNVWTDGTGGECVPVCRVDPKKIDNDVVMDMAIANPKITGNTLINICNTAKREGTNLNGTKIGKLCKRYETLSRN